MSHSRCLPTLSRLRTLPIARAQGRLDASHRSLVALLALIAFLFFDSAAAMAQADEASRSSTNAPLRLLIVDGQNNHGNWPKTTVIMKRCLEASGLFQVDVARTRFTWQGDSLLKEFPLEDGVTREATQQPKPDPDFAPRWDQYDVVLSNLGFGAAPWPEATQESFENYMREGGGLVVVHAANNSFGDWKGFNQMIGVGGWGGRNEKSGPYIYLDESGKTIRDSSAGSGGSHGAQHPFLVVLRDRNHPITKGLPQTWLHANDELYDRLRGPGENLTILATAFASPDQGGSGRHEPMVMTVEYGKGRVFHTPMGHADESVQCSGFQTLLVRGAQWAATGQVTTEVPPDFPTAEESRIRPFQP